MPAPYNDFNTQYPENPWEGVENKQRPHTWYFPELYREYARRAIWNRFVSMQFNTNGETATEVAVTNLLMPHANHDPIGLRQIYADSSYMDSFKRKITFSRYGGKLQLNSYDDLVTYWRMDGVRGLRRIIREGLGALMTKTLDKLARDAFLFDQPFRLFGGDGTGSSFNDIATTDLMNRSILEDIRLGMMERDTPWANDPNGGLGNVILCITTPGAIHDLRQSDATDSFIEINRYSRPDRIFTGEVGTMSQTRFLVSNDAILWNAGAIIAQTTITVPVNAGDGAPDPDTTPVDRHEYVGERGATHSVTVADLTDLEIGDRVTIHILRTNTNGVTDGVDYRDGKLTTRRIVQKSGATGAGTVSFDRPIMENFTDDLGGGVYGYITKGRNIHTATFLGGNDAVVMGVARPPRIHTPGPVDDFGMIQRFSFDMFMGWQGFNKHASETLFIAGTNREIGAPYVR